MLNEKTIAIATTITFTLNVIMTDIYIRFKSDVFKDMVFFYDKTCWKELNNYIEIEILDLILLLIDSWTFEILTVISGLVGVYDQATYVVIISVLPFLYIVPMGIKNSICAIIGNYLFEGKTTLAK